MWGRIVELFLWSTNIFQQIHHSLFTNWLVNSSPPVKWIFITLPSGPHDYHKVNLLLKVSLNSSALCLLPTKWLSVLTSVVSLTWRYWKLSADDVDYVSLSIHKKCLRNNCALHMISPRSWLFQLLTTSLVTWQTSIYSQFLPTLSDILLHVA